MKLAFNELSYAESINFEQITNFFKLVNQVQQKVSTAQIVWLDSGFQDSLLLQKWLSQTKDDTDADLRRLVILAISNLDKSIEKIEYPEYTFNNQICKGLGWAYQNESIAISLLSDKKWETPKIEIVETFFNEELNLKTKNICVKHLSTDVHFSSYSTWVDSFNSTKITSMEDFWDNKEKEYPYLIFCDGVKTQLKKYSFDAGDFKTIREKLKNLNDCCAKWNAGFFDYKKCGINASTESERVKTDKSLKQKRYFICPNKEGHYFYDHIKIGVNRVHFFANDGNPKKVCIGYIGGHLPTANF